MAFCNIIDTSIDSTRDGDQATYVYQADFGEVVVNPILAKLIAQSTGPNPVPVVRTALAAGGQILWCNNVSGRREQGNRGLWRFEAQFGPLPPGEDEEQQTENPLHRPPVYDIQHIEHEYVVKQARNVESLGAEFAAGAPFRDADTLGPIENGARRRPDEPIVRTERLAVVVIERNYADLGEILDINETYQKTTNSDSITLGSHTFSARRLKYEVTRSQGKREENGYVYYPGITEITIHKTTDLILDNVGFEYYTTGSELKRALDEDGEPTAEPINLTTAGLKSESATAVQITFRDLEEVAYASFFG